MKTLSVGYGMNWVKWGTVALLLLAGIVANHFYGEMAWAFRALGWLVLGGSAFFLASMTTQGKAALAFFQASRVELRKVVWPTRQETLQVTLLVLAMVLILGVVLWGMDGILIWLMSWLTGQRG